MYNKYIIICKIYEDISKRKVIILVMERVLS